MKINFESKTFLGSVSTNIVCRPGCLREVSSTYDSIFLENLHDLVCYGMRECQECNPLSYDAPSEIKELLDIIQNNCAPDKKFDSQYIEAIDWVSKKHKIDLLKYVCAKRSNFFLEQNNNRLSLLDPILTYQRYITPIGIMLAVFSNRGLCLLEFSDRRMLESELQILRKRYKTDFLFQVTEFSKMLGVELSEYFNGLRRDFTVPLDIFGTEFQVSVWKVLQKIIYGSTNSYKDQANLLKRPEAVRAVANANGQNRIAIIIPCHRVIGQGGALVGYAGGLDRKDFLLKMEKKFASN